MFCGTDRMAMGAYDYLKETGRRIPQDVGVAGFDNQLLIVAQVRPALTTIALPHYEMRKQAVQLALSHAIDAESRHAALPPPGRPEHGRGLCAHDIAATKTKARILVWLGFLMSALGAIAFMVPFLQAMKASSPTTTVDPSLRG